MEGLAKVFFGVMLARVVRVTVVVVLMGMKMGAPRANLSTGLVRVVPLDVVRRFSPHGVVKFTQAVVVSNANVEKNYIFYV